MCGLSVTAPNAAFATTRFTLEIRGAPPISLLSSFANAEPTAQTNNRGTHASSIRYCTQLAAFCFPYRPIGPLTNAGPDAQPVVRSGHVGIQTFVSGAIAAKDKKLPSVALKLKWGPLSQTGQRASRCSLITQYLAHSIFIVMPQAEPSGLAHFPYAKTIRLHSFGPVPEQDHAREMMRPERPHLLR